MTGIARTRTERWEARSVYSRQKTWSRRRVPRPPRPLPLLQPRRPPRSRDAAEPSPTRPRSRPLTTPAYLPLQPPRLRYLQHTHFSVRFGFPVLRFSSASHKTWSERSWQSKIQFSKIAQVLFNFPQITGKPKWQICSVHFIFRFKTFVVFSFNKLQPVSLTWLAHFRERLIWREVLL